MKLFFDFPSVYDFFVCNKLFNYQPRMNGGIVVKSTYTYKKL